MVEYSTQVSFNEHAFEDGNQRQRLDEVVRLSQQFEILTSGVKFPPQPEIHYVAVYDRKPSAIGFADRLLDLEYIAEAIVREETVHRIGAVARRV